MSEALGAHPKRLATGFYDKFMRGTGLDIGYKGAKNSPPVLPTATGIDLGYPGYDGIKLPFSDASQDYVFSSHMLEHVPLHNVTDVVREWYRVTKVGGHIICIVPHQHLYEKRRSLPSKWNHDHKQFFWGSNLLMQYEMALPVNSYRVRHMRDNDDGFDYKKGPDVHSSGGYEIELVLQKIVPPSWKLA